MIDARHERRGVWADPRPVSPREGRAKMRNIHGSVDFASARYG